MAEPLICGRCGARNPTDAEWCGQCFASLREETEPVSTVSDDPTVAPPEAEVDAGPVEISVADDEEPKPDSSLEADANVWVCSVCEKSNPLEEQHCSVCGTSIFRSFGAEEEQPAEVEPQRALLRSTLFPGLGHSYAGQGVLGAAIGGLTVMALGFGIALATTNAARFGLPLLLLALGLWIVAALDAFRIAGGEMDAILLRPRVVTTLAGLVVIMVIVAAFNAWGNT